jgi:hypothetical protein
VSYPKHILVAALLAAFSANAGAGPFGADQGFGEVCAAVAGAREAPPDVPPAWLADLFEHPINPARAVDDECSAAFVERDARLPASTEKSSAAFHQPVSQKE